MRSIFLFILLSFCSFTFAQIHEIGVFLGGSNYVGDVGKTNYISPNEAAFGVVYKYNKSPRHAYRFSYMQSKITGNDLDSKSSGRQLRGYNFENSIKEISAGLEFNFFEFNLHEFGQRVTPYVFSGVSFFAFDEQFVVSGKAKQDYASSSFAIPIVVGIKSNITPSLLLAAEVGARYTFTDNLDASNPANENVAPLRFGNQNNNDWYVFSGFTLTYTFGDKPCYCND